jgi:hypothetical protein
MKTAPLTLIAGILLAVTACIPSVHPFYTADDVAFDPALVGEWTATDSEDQPEQWKFERGANKEDDTAYALTVTDKDGKQGHFRATLFRLKDHRFLDLIPSECNYAADQAALVGLSMVPGHLLVHVAAIEPELTMAFSDFDWLEDYLKEHPGALAHHTEEDRILLTASTRHLQRFVLKHVSGGELFSDHGRLTRVRQTGE